MTPTDPAWLMFDIIALLWIAAALAAWLALKLILLAWNKVDSAVADYRMYRAYRHRQTRAICSGVEPKEGIADEWAKTN